MIWNFFWGTIAALAAFGSLSLLLLIYCDLQYGMTLFYPDKLKQESRPFSHLKYTHILIFREHQKSEEFKNTLMYYLDCNLQKMVGTNPNSPHTFHHACQLCCRSVQWIHFTPPCLAGLLSFYIVKLPKRCENTFWGFRKVFWRLLCFLIGAIGL